MATDLDRYFAVQLAIFHEYDVRRRPNRVPDKHAVSTFSEYAEYFEKKANVIKQLLAKDEEGAEEIRKGLIDLLDQTISHLVSLKGTAREAVEQKDGNSTLKMLLNVYWAAAMCACSGGKHALLVSCSDLPRGLTIILARVLKQVRGSLRRRRFKNKLDVVLFFERYQVNKHNFKRWRFLLYRIIPFP